MKDLYRRSPHLVCYWWRSKLVLENYTSRSRFSATPLTCEILHFFDRWRSAQALVKHFPQFSPASLRRAVRDLVRARLLQRSPRRKGALADPFVSWRDWEPSASLFHFATKDAHSPVEPEDSLRELRQRVRTAPMPAVGKYYSRVPQFLLPPLRHQGEFPRVLLARRTWRQFSHRSIPIEKLAALLGLSFGVQSWLHVRGLGKVPLKTSPSGGARHPIEAYMLALRVRGLPRGLYHYAAGAHRLELLRRGASSAEIVRYLNGQWWFAGAAAVVLMTAVFERTQWKYPAPRGYRIVLIDAGHVCQTFCLVATWLGLAPFSTMALADSRIESALRIDGIGESVLYAAGVGVPPRDADWAPWPNGVRQGTRYPNPPFS